jgi:glycosyltransferase
MLKISIITICFNNETDIRPTLESVINQTYPDIEYIIVDGASKDNTLAIVNEYKDKIVRIISEQDNGLYDAINKGIKAATGDIVGLIHAGDRLYDNHVIEKIAKHFEENDIDISYGHSKIVNQKDIPVRINKSPDYKQSLVRWGWMPSHQSIYVKRELFEKYGYYNLELHPSSDYEWFLRYFYFNRLKIKRLNEYIIKFSMGGISTISYTSRFCSDSKNQIKDCWKINGENPPFGIVYSKLIRKIKQFVLAKLIH